MAENEEGELPQSRVFWVWLTVYGTFFATGIYELPDRPIWGAAFSIIGAAGLAVLVRDRLKAAPGPVRTALKVLGCLTVAVLVGQLASTIIGLRDEVNAYVMPRRVTPQQAATIRKALQSHPSDVTVAVFVSSADREATEYAAEIMNAIKAGSWAATLYTVNPWEAPQNPNLDRFKNIFFPTYLALDEGVMVRVGYQGERGNSDPRHPWPDEVLTQTLQEAGITNGGGGGANQQQYSLIVEVGRRPVAIRKRSWFLRFRWWLAGAP